MEKNQYRDPPPHIYYGYIHTYGEAMGIYTKTR
jgi:hypothetical protein